MQQKKDAAFFLKNVVLILGVSLGVI